MQGKGTFVPILGGFTPAYASLLGDTYLFDISLKACHKQCMRSDQGRCHTVQALSQYMHCMQLLC